MTLKYDHLLGLEFNQENRNCYTLLRDFYRDNFGIELPDIACPTNWWNHGLDLYGQLAVRNGFSVVNENPRDWLPGDVIVMAIGSSTGSHIAVVLDNGNILHHLVGQRSTVTSYGGLFRNTTVAVYRHRDVPKESAVEGIDFKDLDLPPHVRRRLEAIQEARDSAEAEAAAGS